MINLNVQFSGHAKPFGSREVGRMVKALEKRIDVGTITIGVHIANSQKVREINKQYAGNDEPTDVLSFNYQEGKTNPKQEKGGDIVVSYEHLLEQARKSKTSAETELALLILHGILHILGYDHQNQTQQQKLDELQKQVMEAAGLKYRNFGWKD